MTQTLDRLILEYDLTEGRLKSMSGLRSRILRLEGKRDALRMAITMLLDDQSDGFKASGQGKAILDMILGWK